MQNEKLFKRMKALLAMSRDANSEHEAAIAMGRLHKLLSEHNISITDLDGEETAEPIDESGVIMRNRPWRRNMANMICKLYFCDMYMIRQGNNVQLMIVGTEVNREFAKAIIKMACKMVQDGSKQQAKENRPTSMGYDKTDRSAFMTSFLHGASDRVAKRCRDMIDSAKAGTLQDEHGSTLPVLASVYDTNKNRVDDFLANHGLVKGKQTKRQIRDSLGHAAGTSTGNRVQLTRSLQGNSQKLLG